jgi:hypothetical protein
VTAETSTAPTSERVTHIAARQRWGAPDEWEGSVNDPRTREEHGIRFNEKWVYVLADGSRRLVYWHRYDFRGALREQPNGSVEPESI